MKKLYCIILNLFFIFIISMQCYVFSLAPKSKKLVFLRQKNIFQKAAIFVDLRLFCEGVFPVNTDSQDFILGNSHLLFQNISSGLVFSKEKNQKVINELKKINSPVLFSFIENKALLYNWIVLSDLLDRQKENNLIRFFIKKMEYSFSTKRDYSKKDFEKIKTDLEFILAELLKNAFVHGNHFDLSKEVYVGWEISHKRLTIKVGDYGTEQLNFRKGKAVFIKEKKGSIKQIGQIIKKIFVNHKVDVSFKYFLSLISKVLELTGNHWGIELIQNRCGGIISSKSIMNTKNCQIGKYVYVSLLIYRMFPKKKKIKISS